MRNRFGIASFVACCLLGAVACGDDEAVAPPQVIEAPGVLIVTLDVDAVDLTEVEQAAEVVRRRLDALGVEGEVGWDEETIEVLVPGGDEELVRAAMEPIGELEFRPVLEMLDPASSTPPSERSALDPAAEVIAAGTAGELYRLGPVALGGEAVEGTVVAHSSATWSLNPTLVEGAGGIDAFNAIAAACHEAATACPGVSPGGRGQLAIVFDGVVLSAPAVQTPTFERDQIQISGDFSEAEARALAVSLDAGVSPVRWTVRN